MSSKRQIARYLHYLIYFVPIVVIIGGYGLLTVATQENFPFTIVTGTSMQPTILPGSVALIDKIPFNQLQTGNIIVFAPTLSKMFPCDTTPASTLTSETSVPCFVIHRIINIQSAGTGNEIITTKGDANPGSIPLIDTNISQSMYIGKVEVQFPLAGYVTEAPYNEYIALIIFGALIGELYFERKQSGDKSQTVLDSSNETESKSNTYADSKRDPNTDHNSASE